jgi:hypothetical protein
MDARGIMGYTRGLTKLLSGKFVVAGAKSDEVDEMWARRYIGCSNARGRLPVAAISGYIRGKPSP